MPASALYTGEVRHNRLQPHRHAFRYRLFLLYLDLSELDTVFHKRWLWSVNRLNLASFHESDYLPGLGDGNLEERARGVVSSRLGTRPSGPIRLLTHPRYYGYVFNPVSFYYCFAADSYTLEAVIAEVHNTPWNERHCYVLDAIRGQERTGDYHFRTPKALHVSPFLAMDYIYDWRLSLPGERLELTLRNEHNGRPDFSARLSLERRALAGRHLAHALARHPFMTGKISAAIYWQALRLWWRGIPVKPHPGPGTR